MANAMGMDDAREAKGFIITLKLQEDCGGANLKMSDYGIRRVKDFTVVCRFIARAGRKASVQIFFASL